MTIFTLAGEIYNPYRVDSKLFKIFKFMSDNRNHTLAEITDEVYFYGARLTSLYRRRAASALRTIRKHSSIFMVFDGISYRMID